MSKRPKKRTHRRPSKAARRNAQLPRDVRDKLQLVGAPAVTMPVRLYDVLRDHPPTYFGISFRHE